MGRTRAVLALLAAALAFAAPGAAHAQRDTIRLGGDGQPRDTITLSEPDTAPAQPRERARWSRPFAVEGSGELAPRPPAREVVWLSADTVRARRLAARRDSAGQADEALAAADSAEADADESADAEPTPPARRRTTAAARDSVATGRRTTRTARADTASTRRRAASADEDEGDEAPPATRTTRRTSASRDSAAAAARRTAARDSAAARRASSRDTASTRRSTSARPRTHTVAARETLFGIARRYGVTSAQIRAVNPDLGETLEIGTVLRLPAGARAPASRADAAADERDRPAAPRRPAGDADEAPRPAAARRARRHTVVAGETLYGLARRFGVTVDAIRGANRLPSDNLRPGQVLIIPATPPQR